MRVKRSATRPFRLVVISPETEDTREHAVLAGLFAAGLTHYHLRKPAWSRDRLAAWLRALPEAFPPRILLHTHHDLATDFPLAGLHDRDTSASTCHLLSDNSAESQETENQRIDPTCHLISDKYPAQPPLLRSRAVHDLAALRAGLDTYDRLLFSPVFPSISKPGHAPVADSDRSALRSLLARPRRAEVLALGGIDASRLPACRQLSFDGAAVLGAVWQAPDPVDAFRQLQAALENSLPLRPALDSGLSALD